MKGNNKEMKQLEQLKQQNKILSKLSLACGIAPWITMWIPILNLLNVPLAIAAVVFGHIAKNKEEKNGMRLAGMILGYVSLGFTVIGLIFIAIFGALFFL